MRTKRIKLYSFNELSTEAQEKVMLNYGHKPEEREELIEFLSDKPLEYLSDGTIYTQ